MFEEMMDGQVILEVRLGDVIIPIQGLIIGETDSLVRFRIDHGWEVDVFKTMVKKAHRIEEKGELQ